MSSQRTWICDGEPKDGKQYPNCSGPHEPYENYGPDCAMCGLPKEAMSAKKTKVQPAQKTVVSKPGSGIAVPVAIAALLVVLGGGFGVYKFLEAGKKPEIVNTNSSPTTSPVNTPAATPVTINSDAIISETATNSPLISQGEKILLSGTNNPQKDRGATAFAAKKWDEAIAQYQKANATDPNDPESKIYLNNAKAKKSGNLVTMAVVVSISTNPDSAREILRGAAQAQDDFNRGASGKLLEIAIANDVDPNTSASLAQDLIKSPNILAVLGHGVDDGSKQAIALYEQAGLTVLSPISTSITSSGGQSTLKTVSINQKANELLSTYLKTVGETLAKYASQQSPNSTAIVFYSSDSPYSQQLKQELTAALTKVNGKIVKEIDIKDANFNAATALQEAKAIGAKVAFLALNKKKVDVAIEIAKANGNSQLKLIGADELYNPTILLNGGDAIANIVLAVPWSYQEKDNFARQAVSMWKGRVSWRTATAYDATLALANSLSSNGDRAKVSQALQTGIAMKGVVAGFNSLNEVPLVKAVPGKNGPPGSKYQFDPI